MPLLRTIAIVLFFLWMVADNAMVFPRRTGKAENLDRHSLRILAAGSTLACVIAIWLSFTRLGQMPRAMPWQIAGLVVMALGIAVRFTAIVQLGRYHTPNVAILDGHEVFDRGLYRYIRHPSYLGALIAFLGFGLALGNWLSLLALTVLTVSAYMYRIHEEEAALRTGLGEQYVSYCRRTHCLIPGIF
ncbi:MAG: methyltransferase family protein [Rhodanobacteraceae bacterium]